MCAPLGPKIEQQCSYADADADYRRRPFGERERVNGKRGEQRAAYSITDAD